jgi:hypothetical protein
MSETIQTRPSASDEAADKSPPFPQEPASDDPLLASKPSQDTQKGLDAPSIDVRALTDSTLHFLATASNETLGACLVGLGAGTYLVLGRVGLILIGVLGGVVLHATWEGHAHSHVGDKTPVQEARKREAGVDVARRVLDWRGKTTPGDEKILEDDDDLDVRLHSGKELDFSDFRPETAAALTELTDAVIRDYVKCVLVTSSIYVHV